LDGTHTIEITVEDDVGNLATVTRSFVLDRAGPRLDVSWPREGLTYTAPFTPEYTVTDGFTPSDQIAVTCALDGGPYGPCGQMAPADGAHTLSVRAVDLANNQTVEETSFTYDAPNGGGQGGTGGEGQSAPPPTADATAPRWTFRASRQRSAKTRRISFILTTNESCLLSVTAKLGRKRLGALTQPLAAGAPGAQRLTLSKKSLVALRKALRRKKTVTVTLAIACVDGAGNTSKANRRITVRR
jgi:hypothetical protein